MPGFDLVFEGGGAKGSVFVGALEVFYGAGHTHSRLVGTSAGAITATFLAAGYSPQEMLAAVTEQKNGKPRFASFMDPPSAADFDARLRTECQLMNIFGAIRLPIPDRMQRGLDSLILNQLLEHSPHFRQIFSFVECGGLYSGKAFCEWLTEKLQAKDVAPGCTLRDFNRGKRCDLSLVVTDTTNREMMVLNHRTAPDVPVVMAVRMSMSIPFIWREVEWQEQWGPYREGGNEIHKTGAKIVDGGVLSNFPIDLIATAGDRAKAIMGGDTDPDRDENLGMLIDESLEVPGVPPVPERKHELRTVRRIQRLVDTMSGARDNALIREFRKAVCRLPARGYGTTEFDMPGSKIEKLVEAGRAAMRSHLSERGLI
jgi:predicted acylesterase/phospholipase RssA